MSKDPTEMKDKDQHLRDMAETDRMMAAFRKRHGIEKKPKTTSAQAGTSTKEGDNKVDKTTDSTTKEFVEHILSLKNIHDPEFQGVITRHNETMNEIDSIMTSFKQSNGIEEEPQAHTPAQIGVMGSPSTLPAAMHINSSATLERKPSGHSAEEGDNQLDKTDATTISHTDSLKKTQLSSTLTPEGTSNSK